MGKKIFMYDSFGDEFYACEFEGLDANGKPRLTIMTPGCPVESFSDYLDLMEESPIDYNLLCEEGKTAASKQVVEMMAQIYVNANRPFDRMAERLEDMRKLGISYGRDQQRVTVRIYEWEEEKTQSTSYLFDLKVGDRFVESFKKFNDVKDIVMKLTGFFFYIENNVNIPVKKCLEVSESLKKQVIRHSSNMFEEVEII